MLLIKKNNDDVLPNGEIPKNDDYRSIVFSGDDNGNKNSTVMKHELVTTSCLGCFCTIETSVSCEFIHDSNSEREKRHVWKGW